MSNEFTFNKCVIVGLGYIGLPTSVVVARSGIQVAGIDINPTIVAAVNEGRCPIEEPHLPVALAMLVKEGRIVASNKPEAGDVFIIAVPTPFTGGYKPDLSYVQAATRSIAPFLKKGNLVIVESTIPVGATETVGRWIEGFRPDLTCSRRDSDAIPDILVAHCPERVLPGRMLRELLENDRVIGGVCKTSARAGKAFYQTFVTGNCLVTDARTAELCKLAENSFRDVNIAFANELADICEDFKIDVWELIQLANHHPRVNILKPGPGVGGHCIAVDPWFIVSALGEKARLIREARWINSGRPRQIVLKIMARIAAGNIRSIGCLGLAFKQDVDDLRESPAIEIVEYLRHELHMMDRDFDIRVVEPHIQKLPAELGEANGVRLVNLEEALAADLIVLLVDHAAFRQVPSSQLANKNIIDTRGIWGNNVTNTSLAGC